MRNRNKIRHEKSTKYINLREDLSLDLGMYQVKAEVRLSAERVNTELYEVYNIDVDDIDVDFYIDSKRCQFQGFKELYEKLFGENTYTQMVDNLGKDFSKHAYENCMYPNVEDLPKRDLKKLFYDLLENVPQAEGKYFAYADDFQFLNVAKLTFPDAIEMIDAPYVNSDSGRSYSHQVVNLDLVNR